MREPSTKDVPCDEEAGDEEVQEDDDESDKELEEGECVDDASDEDLMSVMSSDEELDCPLEEDEKTINNSVIVEAPKQSKKVSSRSKTKNVVHLKTYEFCSDFDTEDDT